MRHSSAALDAFAWVVKVMNHTGLWDIELAWYSLNATCFPLWIGTWPQNQPFKANLTLPDCQGSCNQKKFSWTIWLLYWDQLHLHLFHNKWFFGCFHSIMTQFELIMYVVLSISFEIYFVQSFKMNSCSRNWNTPY